MEARLAQLELAVSRLSAVPERLATLEQQLATLLPLAEAESQQSPGHKADRRARRFKPVAPAACENVRPCLRSTAHERIAAGCPASMWRGQWDIDPLTTVSSALRGKAGWSRQHFRPADELCEAADPFVLAPTHSGHVTVATGQFTTARLRGLRDALWLMIGTSIDHGVVYEVCVRFGREGTRVADAPPTSVHPRPGLHFNWCTLPPPLNLTMVEVSFRGLTTMTHQRDASLHRRHLVEVQGLLSTIGWRAGPTFVTLAGIEWDLKQWASQRAVPTSAAEWVIVRESLLMQATVARRLWPGLRGLTLRTQFRTTYRFSKEWVDQDAAHYARYSQLMRDVARTQGRRGERAAERSLDRRCGRVDVLDMAAFMNCSAEIGYPNGCGRGGASWTRDGLHPQPWVYHQYFVVAANVLADQGEACGAVA